MVGSTMKDSSFSVCVRVFERWELGFFFFFSLCVSNTKSFYLLSLTHSSTEREADAYGVDLSPE